MVRGFRVTDIGTFRLSWREFASLVAHLPPTGESALYRARFPKSWWWTHETDLLAAQVHALQGANWQRSGSKGDPPEVIMRPREVWELEQSSDSEAVPLDEIRNELARRRRDRANG